jgi:hypothetical protein
MASRIDHTHKFKRGKYKNTGTRYFFCADDCDYKVAIENALGKTCICWRCLKPFKLNSYSLRLSKPHCEDCHMRREEVLANAHNDRRLQDRREAERREDSERQKLAAPDASEIVPETDLESELANLIGDDDQKDML